MTTREELDNLCYKRARELKANGKKSLIKIIREQNLIVVYFFSCYGYNNKYARGVLEGVRALYPDFNVKVVNY